MNTDSNGKEIQYQELEEYKKKFIDFCTSIFEIKACTNKRLKKPFAFNCQNFKYAIQIDLEMKIPSYKEMKKFCSFNFSELEIFESNNAHFCSVFQQNTDNPSLKIYSDDKVALNEIKKTYLAKIKEND